MNRDRWIALGGLIAVVLGAVAFVIVLSRRQRYHVWPGSARPDRLVHCGRFYGDGDTVAAADAPALELAFRFTPPLAEHHDVYAEPSDRFENDDGARCPMALWMRIGDEYVLYSLMGGP